MKGLPELKGSRGWLLVIAGCSVVWGSIPLLLRGIEPVPITLPLLSQPYDAAPVLVVFWRVVVAATAMLAYLGSRRRLRSILAVDARTLMGLALNGALLALHWFLFFSALTLTDVAVAELLTFTGPIYVAALTPVVLRERFDTRVFGPIALALIGMVLVLGPDVKTLGSGTKLTGALMALLAALVFAFLMLNAKRLLRGLSPSVVMFWETVVAAAILLPAAIALPGFELASSWTSVLTLGLVHSGIVAFVFLGALRHVRADHAAVLMYVEPVSAVLLAALFLGEPLGIATVVGGAAVVGSGVLVAGLSRSPGIEGPFADIEGVSATD